MKKSFKYFFLFYLLFFVCRANAQQSKTDSLLTLLKTDKEDTNKVNHLNALAEEFRNNRPDTAVYFAQQGLKLALENKFQKGIAEAELWWGTAITSQGKYEEALTHLNKAAAISNTKKTDARIQSNIGNIYYLQGNYPDALKEYFASLKIREEIGDKYGIASSHNNIGNIYAEQGNYPEALKEYFALLNIAKEKGDKYFIAASHNNIGNIYINQGNYPEALKECFASLSIAEEIGDKQGIVISHNNIGGIYYGQGNYPEALKEYFASLKIREEIGDKRGVASSHNEIGNIYTKMGNYPKALKEHFSSLKIREEIGDTKGIAASHNNIGNIYTMQGNYPEALKEHFSSLKIKEEIGDKKGIASSHINMGEVFFRQGKAKEGRNELEKGLALGKEIGHKDIIKSSYSGLAEVDSALGDHKKALENYKMYIIYRDSLLNEENTKKTVQTQMQYDFDKKEALTQAEHEKQIAVSEAENKREKSIRYSVIGILLLVLIFTGIVFRSLRITQKQKRIIEKQKEEVTRQRDLVEEQRASVERHKNSVEAQKRIVEEQREEIANKNKEMTDSIHYAQHIQSAILTSEQYLNDMFLPQGQVSSHFILYKPKDIVAGDFYWAYKTPDEKAIWVAADSTGHGVPGAFMSMIGNSLLNEIVVEKGIYEPDVILNMMREGIIKTLGQGGGDKKKDGMDAALCCWDKANNKISFAGANNSLWIIRPTPKGFETLSGFEVIEIEPDIQPIGHYLEMNKPFTKKEFQLQPGDALYTFTDGYCDQFGGPKGKKFKYKPFKELLLSIQDKSMPEQKQILHKTIDEWRGQLEQIDDICVFGVRV